MAVISSKLDVIPKRGPNYSLSPSSVPTSILYSTSVYVKVNEEYRLMVSVTNKHPINDPKELMNLRSTHEDSSVKGKTVRGSQLLEQDVTDPPLSEAEEYLVNDIVNQHYHSLGSFSQVG